MRGQSPRAEEDTGHQGSLPDSLDHRQGFSGGSTESPKRTTAKRGWPPWILRRVHSTTEEDYGHLGLLGSPLEQRDRRSGYTVLWVHCTTEEDEWTSLDVKIWSH
ncbi:hypothetical protein OUZ56_004896 [Daphnia magna]|uniref:Uncharacterized protein n=1 Tax=Daphnia magna TaxID=35525 RepID=A0ABQ9YRC7_9CRUS|nr:hypothetical protein OUZ56_004896 [Daphnia magna]